MTSAVEIWSEVATATKLGQQAKREPRRQTAVCLLAAAKALDSMSRAEAA